MKLITAANHGINESKKMKTQINNLRSGANNQVTNMAIDYSELPKATSHNGHAGTNHEAVNSVWEKLILENPDKMTIKIFGNILELKANWSVSRKSVSYSTSISNEFLEDNFMISASKDKIASLSIDFGTIIRVSNGKNSYRSVCPSLIDIL